MKSMHKVIAFMLASTMLALPTWAAEPVVGENEASLDSAKEKDGAIIVNGLAKLAKEITEIAERDADLQKGNIVKAMDLVDKKIMPLLDKERLVRRSLGKFWRDATPEQKEKLMVLIPRLLGKTYAKALFELKGSTVVFAKPRMNDGRAKVAAKVSKPGSNPMQIGFTASLSADGTVMVDDVEFEGVSLMSSFGQSFKAIASQKGLDGLIKDLEAKLA